MKAEGEAVLQLVETLESALNDLFVGLEFEHDIPMSRDVVEKIVRSTGMGLGAVTKGIQELVDTLLTDKELSLITMALDFWISESSEASEKESESEDRISLLNGVMEAQELRHKIENI
jgi:hypothetical protein